MAFKGSRNSTSGYQRTASASGPGNAGNLNPWGEEDEERGGGMSIPQLSANAAPVDVNVNSGFFETPDMGGVDLSAAVVNPAGAATWEPIDTSTMALGNGAMTPHLSLAEANPMLPEVPYEQQGPVPVVNGPLPSTRMQGGLPQVIDITPVNVPQAAGEPQWSDEDLDTPAQMPTEGLSFTGTPEQAERLSPEMLADLGDVTLVGNPDPGAGYAGPGEYGLGVSNPVMFPEYPEARARVEAETAKATEAYDQRKQALRGLRLERQELRQTEREVRKQRKIMPDGLDLRTLRRGVESANSPLAIGGGVQALIEKQMQGEKLSKRERRFLSGYQQMEQMLNQTEQLDALLDAIPDRDRELRYRMQTLIDAPILTPDEAQDQAIQIEQGRIAQDTARLEKGAIEYQLKRMDDQIKQAEKSLGSEKDILASDEYLDYADFHGNDAVDDQQMLDFYTRSLRAKAGLPQMEQQRAETQKRLDQLMGFLPKTQKTQNKTQNKNPNFKKELAALKAENPDFSEAELKEILMQQ